MALDLNLEIHYINPLKGASKCAELNFFFSLHGNPQSKVKFFKYVKINEITNFSEL